MVRFAAILLVSVARVSTSSWNICIFIVLVMFLVRSCWSEPRILFTELLLRPGGQHLSLLLFLIPLGTLNIVFVHVPGAGDGWNCRSAAGSH
jgi:hypothetical protein